jgi:hypothetical protein
VAKDVIIEGPGWVASGLDESSGLYPLRVEPAVGRLVERLLPGVITTTTGARYFGLHALAWSDARDRSLDDDASEDFVRRCEVVLAGVAVIHGDTSEGHRRIVPAAHGEDRIHGYFDGGALDVASAAAPGGYSKAGFAGTYAAPERALGLLSSGWPPRLGPRADTAPLREGLGLVLELARHDILSTAELATAADLCPCCAAEGADGRWLQRVMFEEADAEGEGDRNRQITALMLLEALDGGPHDDPERPFRLAHGFGGPIEGDTPEARARRAWRAAILRNYSVSAWRHLWRWLSEQLVGEAITARELGDLLADALGADTVSDLILGLPVRVDSDGLRPIEEELRSSEDPTPVRSLRQLAIGALRLVDLDGETRNAFLGRDRDDLGPAWMQHQLTEHADTTVADLGRDLAQTMLHRAQRVATSKMRMGNDLRPYVPTRLRDRDGLLSMVGTEPDADVSLRGWTLAQVMAGLGAIDHTQNGYTTSASGQELRGRLQASIANAT